MSKMLSAAGLGLLATCLVFATPSAGHAQDYRYGPYDHAPRYTTGYAGYVPRSSYDYRWYGGGGYGYGHRPAIVHPEYEHWTPGRGWHTHGHIHVPHRGHYHTVPY